MFHPYNGPPLATLTFQYGREQFVGDDGVEWSVKLD